MNNNVKPIMLVVYDYFYPAYKAGGPIQSLKNMITALQDLYEIFVLTGAYDLNSGLLNVKTDVWEMVVLPESEKPIKVWYISNLKQRGIVRRIATELKPDFVYLNGIFSYKFFLKPLLQIPHSKIIICPRGMLQAGALSVKPVKKKIYLTIIKWSGILRRVSWHATTEDEKSDIVNVFGKVPVKVAGNIARKPPASVCLPAKTRDHLRLVYLSLITRKKNLLQLIELISQTSEGITLDIYGPVKDEMYWKECSNAISKAFTRVRYMGAVKPELVQDTFAKYHASVLLTKGENFGHSLYESMSVGRPVITSTFTPWNNLEHKGAGWNVDLSDSNEIVRTLNGILLLDQSQYHNYCTAAYKVAVEYHEHSVDITAYRELFNLHKN